MAPFLIKHPQVIDSWIRQREQALYEIMQDKNTHKTEQYKNYIQRAILFFSDFQVPEKNQQKKNDTIVKELKKILAKISKQTNSKKIWQEMQKYTTETQELFLNILLESHPEISQKHDKFVCEPSPTSDIISVKIKKVIQEIERGSLFYPIFLLFVCLDIFAKIFFIP